MTPARAQFVRDVERELALDPFVSTKEICRKYLAGRSASLVAVRLHECDRTLTQMRRAAVAAKDAHFEKMQDAMRMFVTPTDGLAMSADEFASNMIGLLDGPEQRKVFPNER